jgi:glycerol-3-phosphate dehydrogenase
MHIHRDLPGAEAATFDVVVIGGGITGVCVAREAAGRGLRTLLVEKKDYGAGTSSATTKYIHGGIRYLETYDFGVVRESLRERRILALSAPHLVRQTRFLLPAWRWSKPGPALLGAGVVIYDALSLDRNRDAPPSLRIGHPHWLSPGKLLAAVPWLDPTDLLGAWAYHDTMNIHPERLLLAFLGSAIDHGAVAWNHVRACGFVTEPAGGGVKVVGVRLTDELTGRQFEVRAAAVVNAAGPWMDVVLAELGRPVGVAVRRSKGVHLLTPPFGGREIEDAVFLRAKSRLHAIVSPWMGKSYIGPTDTAMSEGPDDVAVGQDDVRSLLETVNSLLAPGRPRLAVEEVESATVGIRPLIVEEGKGTYTTSRRHELYDHAARGVESLWSIGGGKWTTGRATGEETIDALLASPALRGRRTRPYSSTRAAAHGAFAWAEEAQPFFEEVARQRPGLPLDRETRLHLARLYGTDHREIFDLVAADPSLAARLSPRPGRLDIAAQAVYAVTNESARTLGDVLDRRLVLGTLGALTGGEIEATASVVAPLLGGDAGALAGAEIERRRAIEARWR